MAETKTETQKIREVVIEGITHWRLDKNYSGSYNNGAIYIMAELHRQGYKIVKE